MITRIFSLVAHAMELTARLWGCTYNEVNVALYYGLVPLSWAILVDIALRRIMVTPVLLGLYCIAMILIRDFQVFADKLFTASAHFLLWFKRVGWNYPVASVILCVAAPLVIYSMLIGWILWIRILR